MLNELLNLDLKDINLIITGAFVLILLAFFVQLKTKNLLSKQLGNIQIEIIKTNKLLSSILGDENNSDSQYTPSENKLYVGNIGLNSAAEDLKSLFSSFGEIELINIPVNKHNGRNRGYGFITFQNSGDAKKATKLHGSDFNGRQIQVNFAKERV